MCFEERFEDGSQDDVLNTTFQMKQPEYIESEEGLIVNNSDLTEDLIQAEVVNEQYDSWQDSMETAALSESEEVDENIDVDHIAYIQIMDDE